ncbi:MAG TPA: MBL fold metallo-hydrolase [Kofleriaceae bacterium]|nr:MBL fold metallo-hydrolase [Kofleriaceae bacterium]
MQATQLSTIGLALALGCSSPSPRPPHASAGTVHVFTSGDAGFHTNSVWYDDGREVTVVDAQFTPELAEQVVADVRAKTRSPITRVIVTHPNPDKFNGLSVFHRLGARSIASRKTAQAIPEVDRYKRAFWIGVAKAFTAETYPKVEPVQDTFDGQTTIRLASGETLTLIELAHPGVSSDQTVVRIDATGDLIVGDLVANHVHAWLEGGIVDGTPRPDLAGWQDDLRALPGLGHGLVYGGRGEPGPVAEVVAAELAYLAKADAIVTAHVGSASRAELTDPAKQQAHFHAIQDELARAFPDYKDPDLVGYGVYGLVLSKLR